MRMHLIHRDKKWPAPKNHYVITACPHCGALVDGYGMAPQHRHQDHHNSLWEWMDWVDGQLGELRKRTGMAEEAVEIPPRYTAEVEGIYPGDEEEASGE
jgi:hypothetical protein